jgi:glycosyltransferase involved in cell wall biosynthesis
MSGISVIICCYNSAVRLPTTLRYLAAQVAGELAWEVVVVDNNSADDTAAVARQQWQERGSPAPLTVVAEPQPGLSMARKTGLAAARHELILFCDDDNWLEDDYLQQAAAIMGQDAAIGVLGGLNTPVADVPLPAWFSDVAYAYACGPQAEQDGEVSPQRLYVAGAGMVVRRNIFRELEEAGFQSQLLDRKGEELSSGGDTELCFATALLGYKIVYSSRLKLFHYMEAKRLTWDYLLKLKTGHAASYYKLEYYKKLYHHEDITSSWLNLAAQKVRAMLSKRGAYILYQSCVNRKNAKADIHTIEAVFYYEMWKAHFRMKNEHASFVRYLAELQTKMTAYRATLERAHQAQ